MNSLISPSSGWTLEDATGINNSGQICAYGTNPSGQTDAFLLTPVPEPSTITLLLASAACVLGYAWRRRKTSRGIVPYLAVVIVASFASVTQAQGVFNMPSGEMSLLFVPVGNPGNAADPATGYGSVGLRLPDGRVRRDGWSVRPVPQRRGKNRHLWPLQRLHAGNARRPLSHWQHADGRNRPERHIGRLYVLPLLRLGCVGHLRDQFPEPLPLRAGCGSRLPDLLCIVGGRGAVLQLVAKRAADKPGRGRRLDRDGGLHAQRGDEQFCAMAVTRNAGATYFIPSDNEWYKAAYYNPSNGTYWTYPTQSNSAPSNALFATGRNNANFDDYYDNPQTGERDLHGCDELPDAGRRVRVVSRSLRQLRHGGRHLAVERGEPRRRMSFLCGGSWDGVSGSLGSQYSLFVGVGPSGENSNIGFRVASVPEPGSLALLVCGGVAVLIWWKRRA